MTTPILVTGAHRSGSTWVGRMLASHSTVAYEHEPLNVREGGPTDLYFQHVDSVNESTFAPVIQSLIDANVPKRTLFKDPIALMAADWLAQRFDMKVVVLIRHPAAFVSSVKVLEWRHPWHHFLRQPRLMTGRLRAFESDIRRMAEHSHSVVEDAKLLWRICHRVIRQYEAEFPQWTFVRHEDLSRRPMAGFSALFNSVGLDVEEACRATVAAHCLQPTTIADLTVAGDPYSIRRNSAENLDNWRHRLTDVEVAAVGEGLEDFEHFYPEPEWHVS